MRESAFLKARRYLAEGRLTITAVGPNMVAGTCRGDGQVYQLGWAGRWYCNCPALTPHCAHLLAARLVTLTPRGATR